MAALEGFWGWDIIGASTLGDVMAETRIASFEQLQTSFELHNCQFFRYLQLHHALCPHIENLQELPEYNPLEARLMTGETGCKQISVIYRIIVNNLPDT